MIVVAESPDVFVPKPQRVLFTRTDATPEKALFIRVSIVIGLMAMVVLVLWLDREGLRDAADGETSFWDVVYFAVVTMTTVGYGDIVPVTERARMIDALYVTPIRIFVWFIFLGTAYQFVFQKFLEEYRMAKLERRLTDHVIICGYGHTGRVAGEELVSKGTPPDQIVVIDTKSQSVEEAADTGLVALRGDAAKEELLQRVGLDNARAVLISPGRDDTAVLIALTVRQLNRSVKIIASAKEEENIKVLKQAGADVIVSPSTVGGYMLADAVEYHRTVEYVNDLLTEGGRVTLTERLVRPDEVGRTSPAIEEGMIVRAYRGQDVIGFWELADKPLQTGDVILVILREPTAA